MEIVRLLSAFFGFASPAKEAKMESVKVEVCDDGLIVHTQHSVDTCATRIEKLLKRLIGVEGVIAHDHQVTVYYGHTVDGTELAKSAVAVIYKMVLNINSYSMRLHRRKGQRV